MIRLAACLLAAGVVLPVPPPNVGLLPELGTRDAAQSQWSPDAGWDPGPGSLVAVTGHTWLRVHDLRLGWSLEKRKGKWVANQDLSAPDAKMIYHVDRTQMLSLALEWKSECEKHIQGNPGKYRERACEDRSIAIRAKWDDSRRRYESTIPGQFRVVAFRRGSEIKVWIWFYAKDGTYSRVGMWQGLVSSRSAAPAGPGLLEA